MIQARAAGDPFEALGDTRVEIEHRLGAARNGRRAMARPQRAGWRSLLPYFTVAIER
jgi:hypothetical protein